MHTRTRTDRRISAGFTLVESLIAVTLLAVLFLAVAQTSSRASDAFEEGSTENTLSRTLHRSLDRIASAIEFSDATILDAPLASPQGSDQVAFRTPRDFVGTEVDWEDIRILLELEPGELDDGVDNDGDGLIDEQRIVRVDFPGTPDERRVVLASGVAELLEGELANGLDDNANGLADETGLSFSSNGSVVTIRLTCQRRDDGGRLLTRTSETAVRLLNTGG